MESVCFRAKLTLVLKLRLGVETMVTPIATMDGCAADFKIAKSPCSFQNLCFSFLQ